MNKQIDEFFGTSSPLNEINYEKELNKEQLEVVNTLSGPVLIIAGAGTGKTKTLTFRLAKLIESGVNPNRILLLTFTNKAAKEMMERAQQLLDDRCNQITGCTYHSFCAKILRAHYDYVGLGKNFTILTPVNSAVVMNILKEENDYGKEKGFPSGKDLTAMFSYAVNKQLEVEDLVDIKWQKYEDYVDDIKILQEKYAEYKLEKNLVDYDDIILLVNKLFKEYPNVCKRYSDLYQYIMVDEYQDSNLIQLELIKLLRQFDNKNICVVGDDQQCIYGFRGSNFKNIINFPEQFDECKKIILIQNYRSNQEILDLSNAVLINALEKYEKELIGQKSKGSKPKLVQVDDQRAESRYVFYKLWQYHEAGVDFKDMAVLMRSSRDSNELETLIATQTGKHTIPFKKFGGLKFLDKESTQDIISFLTVLTNIKSEIYWFRIFKLYPNIGTAYSKKITDGIMAHGIDELINPAHLKRKYGIKLPEIHTEYLKMKAMPFQEQMKYLINYYFKLKEISIKDSKIRDSVKMDELKKLNGDMYELQIFIEMSTRYHDAIEFLEALLLDSHEGIDNSNYVTFSTIHSAKGLEFKVVFILDCIDNSFPGERNLDNKSPKAIEEHISEIEESRRLFYVAITRAKDDLYLMYPIISFVYGSIEKTELSRFLDEDYIYKDYCEVTST